MRRRSSLTVGARAAFGQSVSAGEQIARALGRGRAPWGEEMKTNGDINHFGPSTFLVTGPPASRSRSGPVVSSRAEVNRWR